MNKSLDIVILSVPITNPVPAVAPVLLSACLNEKGITAKGVDFSVEFYKIFSKKYYWDDVQSLFTMGHLKEKTLPRRAVIDFLKFNKKFLLELKKNHNPSAIGLSIFTTISVNYSYILSYSIRKYLPNVKIIMGGKGVELKDAITQKLHAENFYNNGLADLIVLGDCEHVIADVIKNNTYGIYISPAQTVEDLDARPLPKWDEYDLNQYKEIKNVLLEKPYMVVNSSKGCIRKCTFCDVQEFWPNYIYRSPEKVAEEIITAYKKTGIDKFVFSDNLMNGSVTNYRKLNEILSKEIPDAIEYGGYAIFRNKKYMPAEDFKLAKRAGCGWWSIGVESGSEKVRFDMGKKITDEDLNWSINNLLKNKIRQKWLMIVGYPTETEQDFLLTLELMKKYADYASTGLIEISCNGTFMALMNSPIMKNTDYGLINNPQSDKFWTSTKYPNNTFPIRADRWRRFIKLQKELGYDWNKVIDINRQTDEIDILEKIYFENINNNEIKTKTIPIIKI